MVGTETGAEGRSRRGKDEPAKDRTLGTLVRAWNDRGEALPVAVVVSVFDDLLETDGEARSAERPDLDDVVIDDRGVAHLGAPTSLDGLAPLLARALGTGQPADDAVPAQARSLVERLASDDPIDRPADAEQLRRWLRDTLGAPAPREEVLACLESATGDLPRMDVPEASLSREPGHATELDAAEPDVAEAEAPIPPAVAEDSAEEELSEAPTLLPAPTLLAPGETALPVPELADDQTETPTLLPAPSDAVAPVPVVVAVDAVVASADAVMIGADGGGEVAREERRARARAVVEELTVREGSSAEAAQPEEEAESEARPRFGSDPSGARPVVRHEVTRAERPVSLPAAPAARRSARPAGEGRDSLIGPADAKISLVWLVVVAVIAGAIYYTFFT